VTSTSEAPQANPRSYELALRGKGQAFAFTIRNRGITLSDDRLDWTIDGRADAARLDSIGEVQLRTGGGWTGDDGPSAMCSIIFRDGYTLMVSDADKNGFRDRPAAGPYRAFVYDLHDRLVKLDVAARFTAGYRQTQFGVVAVCAIILGAIGIGIPVVALFFRPEFEILLTLGGGLALTIPLFTMVLKNSPRSYDPRQIPTELLP
jgi:hypothetical protein